MNISPISNYSYKALNFKGNNSTNPIENKYESQQKNGPEVKIAPETYMAMHVSAAFDRLEEKGIITTDEDGILGVTPECDYADENFNQISFAADMAIDAIKVSTAHMYLDEIDEQKIPTLVNFEYKNYIYNLESNIQKTKEQIEELDLPDPNELPSIEELIEQGEALNPEIIAQQALARLPEMLEMQEALVETFKTDKANALKEALKECSKAYNSMFFKAIIHGFEGNARAVVADLTANLEMYNNAEISDNNNGTLTYTYTNILGTDTTTIVKNKYNGDYISVNCKSLDESKGFELDFNPDGSIKRLDYLNGVDKSIISIAQKGNRVIARQVFNGIMTERTFIKTENNGLKQTSAQIFMK